jgi:prophage antirepressor-like protein
MATNDIQVFSNSQFGEIRTIIANDGEPRFCLADVCRVLELNPNKVSQRLKDDLLSKYPITDNLGRTQQANFVNEDGLYDAIFDSRKKEARMFRKWVTSEVLPSIRKTGGYMVSKDEDTPEEIMARALQIAQNTLDRQKKRLAEQDLTIERQGHTIQEQSQQLQAAAPKVSYYDDTLMSTNTMTMTQVANSVGMSVHSLTNKLLKAGIIYRQSGQLLLRVPYCNCGLHKTRTNTFTHSDGTIGTSIYTVWTQKGVRFINALCSNGFNVKTAVAVMRRETTPVVATC